MFLFLLIHILILVGQSVIIKKSHFKLNNPTLEENLLPYKKKKKKRFLFTVMLFLYHAQYQCHAQYHSEISLILPKCSFLSSFRSE